MPLAALMSLNEYFQGFTDGRALKVRRLAGAHRSSRAALPRVANAAHAPGSTVSNLERQRNRIWPSPFKPILDELIRRSLLYVFR